MGHSESEGTQAVRGNGVPLSELRDACALRMINRPRVCTAPAYLPRQAKLGAGVTSALSAVRCTALAAALGGRNRSGNDTDPTWTTRSPVRTLAPYPHGHTGMSKLQATMDRFLVEILGCEDIDRLQQTTLQRQSRKADFFHSNRSIVIELKLLEESQVAKLEQMIRRWSQEVDWPQHEGTRNIQDVLNAHPRGLELNEQLSRKVAAVVGRACRNADEQIASTIKTFELDEPMGVLVLLNERVDVLDPKVMATAVSVLLRQGPNGAPRALWNIDTAIVISWAHLHVDAQKRLQEVVYIVPADDFDVSSRVFESNFVEQWAACRGKPYSVGGSISTPEGLEVFNFTGRIEPTTVDLGGPSGTVDPDSAPRWLPD